LHLVSANIVVPRDAKHCTPGTPIAHVVYVDRDYDVYTVAEPAQYIEEKEGIPYEGQRVISNSKAPRCSGLDGGASKGDGKSRRKKENKTAIEGKKVKTEVQRDKPNLLLSVLITNLTIT
jgi:hypothetical protein